MSFDLGTVSYSIATLFLFTLVLAQLKIWSTGTSSFILLVATLVTCIWSAILIFQPRIPVEQFYLVQALEIVKNISWFALLLSILGIRGIIFPRLRTEESPKNLIIISAISLGIPLSLLLYLIFSRFIKSEILFYPGLGGRTFLLGFLLNAIIGLVLLEQVIRNAREHHIWHLKFLCLSLGIFFSYDVYLFSNALLFSQVQDELWQARGAVIVLATPLMAISILRIRRQPIQITVSRRLIFHTGVLMVAGVYLLLTGLTGFYIRGSSTEWGPVLQVGFWVVSLTLLVAVIYSGKMRSILKVYINRHLFRAKYDYRDEWMRISNTLSQTNIDESPPELAIHALANIVDSPGGALWLTTYDGYYHQVAHMEMGWIENSDLTKTDYLIEIMGSKEGMVDIGAVGNELDRSKLPVWLQGLNKAWLLIPLQLHEQLLGFVLLKESRVDFELNLEDYELMKAAGQQAASFLAQMIASDALSEARQFSAFNQVSAFVVHDLKTLNSQLSLMIKNAEKHKSNPSFIEDMISTTEHAVNKMTFLLGHFQNVETAESQTGSTVNLSQLLKDVVANQNKLKPWPSLQCKHEKIMVAGHESELKSSISHLVQNAQEATPDDKTVKIDLTVTDDQAVLTITDTGTGMSREFINTQLFKPFESTKGLTGMGIGVYQCRTTVRKLHGDLRVLSREGEGSVFTITLPLFLQEQLQQE